VEKTMSVRDEPHYRISSSELAAWVEAQGENRWWGVDGDPFLSGLLSWPAPAFEVAPALRDINRTLLVRDRRKPPCGRGELIAARNLDALVTRLGDDILFPPGPIPVWANDRVFYLCWEDQEDEWMFMEDEESTRCFDGVVVAEDKRK
jgi:hypothetical protein